MQRSRNAWANWASSGSVCALTGSALLLSGCAGAPSPAAQNTTAGLACVDDSAHCIGQRKAALNSLVSDPTRKWVKEPATPLAHATGVRLFAFKNKKKDMSCDELAAGKKETDSAPGALRSGSHGLSPAQVSRGVMLAGEVGRELQNEYNRRCKKS